MLFTRCPECNTTFRLTADALAAAEGQVRCGECKSVFNAFTAPDFEANDEERIASFSRDIFGSRASEKPKDRDTAEPEWMSRLKAPAPDRKTVWRIAAAAALLTLLVQNVHYFRGVIAKSELVGPYLQDIYARLGQELYPAWRVSDYRVIDWSATAEPGSGGLGNLVVTANIHNGAMEAQPFPFIVLELKDRWEAVVGSRVFRPTEYLADGIASGGLMTPGETAQARLAVIDPGPDAYGFELDVCIEQGPELLSCARDQVFQ